METHQCTLDMKPEGAAGVKMISFRMRVAEALERTQVVGGSSLTYMHFPNDTRKRPDVMTG